VCDGSTTDRRFWHRPDEAAAVPGHDSVKPLQPGGATITRRIARDDLIADQLVVIVEQFHGRSIARRANRRPSAFLVRYRVSIQARRHWPGLLGVISTCRPDNFVWSPLPNFFGPGLAGRCDCCAIIQPMNSRGRICEKCAATVAAGIVFCSCIHVEQYSATVVAHDVGAPHFFKVPHDEPVGAIREPVTAALTTTLGAMSGLGVSATVAFARLTPA